MATIRQKSKPPKQLSTGLSIHEERKGEYIERSRAPVRATWDEMERIYVEGYTDERGVLLFPSMKELAQRFGMNVDTVQKTGHARNWTFKRDDFRRRMEENRQNKVIEITTETAVKLDVTAANIAMDGLERLRTFIKNATINELYNISMAARTLHQMGRLAVGGATSRDEIDVNIVREARTKLISQFDSIASRIEEETGDRPTH